MAVKLQPLKFVPIFIIGCVITLVCVVSALRLDFFERLERMTYDLRARAALKLPQPAATNLGFVFINESSLTAVHNGSLGYHYGLYWPRQVYGRLVQELVAQGAKAVAFDVIFAGLRPDHPPVQMADRRLIESDDFFALQVRRAILALLWQHGVEKSYDLAIISGTTRQLKLYQHLGFVPFGPLVGTAAAPYQPMYLTLENFGLAIVT